MNGDELWNRTVEYMRKNNITDEKPWRAAVDFLLKANPSSEDGAKLFQDVKESMELDSSGDSLLGKSKCCANKALKSQGTHMEDIIDRTVSGAGTPDTEGL